MALDVQIDLKEATTAVKPLGDFYFLGFWVLICRHGPRNSLSPPSYRPHRSLFSPCILRGACLPPRTLSLTLLYRLC